MIPSTDKVQPHSPRVTIVTPSYNQASYLEQTINSVLDQCYPNLEYIIIDGGSTDGSVEIIQRYERSLSYWVSEPDRGQGHAINKGWQRATGEVIAYLNSDDVYLPGAVTASARFLFENPDTDLVYAGIRHMDENGTVFNLVDAPAFALSRLTQSCFIQQPTVFLRHRLYERIGPISEQLHFALDYEYWLRSARVTTPKRLKRVTAAARYHTSAKSVAQLNDFWREEIQVFDRLFSQATAPYDDPALQRIAYLRRCIYVAGLSSGFSEDERVAAIQRLQKFAPPSAAELTSNIAALDAHATSLYVSSIGAPTVDPIGDRYLILPSLTAHGVVDSLTTARVARRLRAYDALRRLGSPASKKKEEIFGALVATLAEDRSAALSPAFWAHVVRTNAIGDRFISTVRAWHDDAFAVGSWMRKRATR